MPSRTHALLLAGGPAAAWLLLTFAVAGHFRPLLRFDARVSNAAHDVALAHPLWRTAMASVTTTGSTAVLGPLLLLGCVILLTAGRWRLAVFAALAVIAPVCMRLLVLAVVARPRPAGQLAAASGYAYPSGHSTASAAAALTLVLVCWPLMTRRWSRILLAVMAGAWAASVGVSRVALVVHWPSDVLGAWLFTLAVIATADLLRRTAFDQPRAKRVSA
jgi:membrane-associated phospholipid phosphatase